jgi:microcystin-dependent protein
MEPFVGEIRAVGFNYAPNGWATCRGQIMPISQNTALFAILGTTYGGNGTTTFGLPDLQGRVIVQQGQGPGLSPYTLGQVSGDENVTLLTTQLPAHTHGLTASIATNNGDSSGTLASPENAFLAVAAINQYSDDPASGTQMAVDAVTGTLAPVGGSQPHSNMMPYLTTNYIIALQGIFPQRP